MPIWNSTAGEFASTSKFATNTAKFNTKDLLNGIAAYWNMDDEQESVQGTFGIQNLIQVGNVGFQFSGGKPNGSMFLMSASNQYCHIADNPGIRIRDGFTAVAWMKMTTKQNFNPVIVKGTDLGNNAEWGFNYNNIAGGFSAVMGDGTGTSPGNDVFVNVFGFAKTGVWYFVAFTFDGNALTLSVNNGEFGSATNTLAGAFPSPPLVPNYNGTSDLYFGTASGAYLNGNIDGVGIWNRVLTSNEIAYLYNSGNGVDFSTVSQYSAPKYG